MEHTPEALKRFGKAYSKPVEAHWLVVAEAIRLLSYSSGVPETCRGDLVVAARIAKQLLIGSQCKNQPQRKSG